MSYSGNMRHAWGLAITSGLALCSLPACKSGPSDEQCKQLLEHLVNLEFAKAGTASNNDATKADVAKAKAAVIEAKSVEFFDTCKNKMARSRVECALAASSLDGESGVAKCDEAK